MKAFTTALCLLETLEMKPGDVVWTPAGVKRSTRLNLAWRVLYRVDDAGVTVRVERVSNHDYS